MMVVLIILALLFFASYLDIWYYTYIPHRYRFLFLLFMILSFVLALIKPVLFLILVPLLIIQILLDERVVKYLRTIFPKVEDIFRTLSKYIGDADIPVLMLFLSVIVLYVIEDPITTLGGLMYGAFVSSLYGLYLSKYFWKKSRGENMLAFIITIVLSTIFSFFKLDILSLAIFVLILSLLIRKYQPKVEIKEVSVKELPKYGWVEVDCTFYALHIPEERKKLLEYVHKKGISTVRYYPEGVPLIPIIFLLLYGTFCYITLPSLF